MYMSSPNSLGEVHLFDFRLVVVVIAVVKLLYRGLGKHIYRVTATAFKIAKNKTK